MHELLHNTFSAAGASAGAGPRGLTVFRALTGRAAAKRFSADQHGPVWKTGYAIPWARLHPGRHSGARRVSDIKPEHYPEVMTIARGELA